jgi:hypothetical protein
MLCPLGRDTLPELRPKYGLEFEREGDDGIVLCAVSTGLPAGGRGTDRDIGDPRDDEPRGDEPKDDSPGRAPIPLERERSLCGGLGTERPAGCGIDLALLDCPSGPRFIDGAAVLRAAPMFCDAAGLEAPAGGVIRLTVGREVTPDDGLDAGKPAFDPSTLLRVGDASGLPILALDKPRTALGVIFAVFPRTGRPRSRVLRETAVRPFALA